ncbi:MAG: hypothetical protein KDE14_14715 [Rhodobacteraceae bacterium]|nr:hypothetical protein [Paracoccaceae bacterium]
MLRIALTYVVPFLLPITAYAVWIWYRTAYAERHAGAPPKFEEGPWPLMLFLGAVLTFAALAFTALNSGGPPDSTYVPPRLEGGKIVPSELRPRE